MNGIEELRTYLIENKEEFRPEWGGGHDDVLQTEFDSFIRSGKTAEQFYKESKILLYHLTWFGEDQWKRPYHRVIRENFAPPTTMLEYGCGVASDGLKFTELGYEVKFMDMESECTQFAEWRFRTHGVKDAKVHRFNEPLDKVDLVFAFDVVEHVEDPKKLLSEIEQHARHVAVNFLTQTGEPADGKEHLHYHHDAQELVNWIKGHSEIIQERDFDYARFLIYRPNEQIVIPERAARARRSVPAIISPDHSGKEVSYG